MAGEVYGIRLKFQSGREEVLTFKKEDRDRFYPVFKSQENKVSLSDGVKSVEKVISRPTWMKDNT